MAHLILLLFSAFQIIPLAGGQTGTIQGRLTNLDGTPAENVRVTAQPVPDSADAREALVLSSIARTDSAGRFKLENLSPGRYYVAAGLVDGPTYYPGVTGIDSARVVNITAANPAMDINFSLARSAALKIRGKVSFEPRVVRPPTLRVLIAGPSVQQTATPSTDGTFEFAGLPPGRYRLGLSPANGSATQQLVLADQDAEIELVMPFTVTVTGTLAVRGDIPQPRLPITFTEIGNPPNRVIASAAALNGLYNVMMKPGTYEVTYGTPQGFTVESLMSGSVDLMKSPFVVSADLVPEFAAVLNVSDPTLFVKVSGKITGNRRSGLQVRLNGGAGAPFGGGMQSPVAADGSFEFPKVLPGSYTAVFDTEQVTLTVGSRDVTDVQIVMPEVMEVPARVQVEGGGPIPRLTFAIAGASNRLRSVRSTTRREGEFGLELPIGQSTLSVPTPPAGYSIQSMSYDSVNLLTTPINVTPSNRGKEIEVKLALAPGVALVRVAGRIVGASALTGAFRVSLVGETNLRNPINTSNGEFEITQVLPGTYTLRADGIGIGVSMPLTVGNVDVTGVQVQMPSSLKEVSGRMSFDQGASAASTQFSLELTAVNGGDALRVNSMRQSDGSFRIRLPVGEWRVAVSGIPAAMNLKSAFYGDSDLLRGSLKVDPMDSQELRLIVSPRPGTNLVRLRGRVIPPPADNSLRAMYEAVQAPTIRVSGPMILESRIQPDGTFEFPQVLSGTYSWCCNFGYTYFNVPAAGIDNLTLRAIPGRVIVEGATLESPVYVQAADVAGTSAANIAPRDGSFLLILAEGSFRIGMDRVPAGFYVKSIRYGSTDLTNQILVLPRGEDAKELILTLAARP